MSIATDMTLLDLSEFGDAAPHLQPAAEAVAEADSQIGQLVWLAGQKLTFAFNHCPRGKWTDACVAMGLSETRALQFRHVYDRFPERAMLPNVGRELLITLAAPSTPDAVVESVAERADAGVPLSVREVQAEIQTAKAQAPAEFDHDVDRTRMAPEPPSETASDRVQKAVNAVEKAVVKAKAACAESKAKRDWQLLEDTLANLTEDVRNS